MRLSKKVALGVGLLTAVGYVAAAALAALLLAGADPFDQPADTLIRLIPLVGLALLAFYLLYLFRSSRVTGEGRVWWAVALVLGNWLVMPFFWYWHVWLPAAAGPTGGRNNAALGTSSGSDAAVR